MKAMHKSIIKVRDLAFSGTAKDTYILFFGNLSSAFWGFIFTLIVARALSIEDFGVFSAVLNLMVILSSLAEIGMGTGITNYIAEFESKKQSGKVLEIIKASLVVRIITIAFFSFLVILFSPIISTRLLASSDPTMATWAVLVTVLIFPVMFFPVVLQAQRKFIKSVILDNSFYISRFLFVFLLFFYGSLNLNYSYLSFGAGFVISLLLTAVFIGPGFLKSKPTKKEYKNLIGFSGWIGVNSIISSISGRLDIQMLAAMVGATATGLYSIPSRLASFLIVLAGSYSRVLATRLASFGDKEKEKRYIIKSSLALIPICAGVILWVLLAKPFVTLLFGEKYLEAVPVFQALALAQIPFLSTVPAVTAIIYSMKQTVYIGVLSFFQLAVIFALNLYLIPRFGIFGPTLTFGLTNTLIAIYVWIIVIRHYWK